MPAAARLNDWHSCPLSSGNTPHVGGPILPPAAPTVFIEGLPAARTGDLASCTGPTDTITGGSATVFIVGQRAARMNDVTQHGGQIQSGSATVFIGD